jgi:superfamily II DNA helicase RecQ
MYHANTPEHKDVIMKSLSKPDGVVQAVFATVGLGMGVNMRDVNTIIHYGVPHKKVGGVVGQANQH